MALHKPPRPYGNLIKSLRLAWRIEPLDHDGIWCLGRAESQAGPQTVRLSVWNICKGAGGRLFEHDFRVLAYHSDIILLQEALMSKRALETFCQPGFELVHAGSYQRRDRLRDGVATISRISFSAPLTRIRCLYPEPVFKTPKVALASFHPVAAGEKKLLVINLHATLIRSTKKAVEEIRNLLDQCPAHDGPAILCGDFNTFTPRMFSKVRKTIEQYGFEHIDVREDPRKSLGRLDHAFARNVLVEKAEVMWTIRSSDHFPLMFHINCAP